MTTELRAYVGLGANLGDACATLEAACRELASVPGVRLVARSSWWRSAPVEAQGPDFINAVVALDTTLAPLQLLGVLQDIERGHGRQRPYRNAPRTLDLDLLLHSDLRMDGDRLTLPHPRGHLRAFVLRPLAELAPALVWPGQGGLAQLCAATADQDLERLA